MIKLLVPLALMAFSTTQYVRALVLSPIPTVQRIQNLKLCTYSNISHEKCFHAVIVAQNNSIPLDLECERQEDFESCINAVASGKSDMVVLTGHGYKKARSAGLRPLIFAKESDESLYMAVAPKNITFVGVQEAPIYFEPTNHRAFHAATLFNLRMGHDICRFIHQASLATNYISIMDSADYVFNPDEILICPHRIPSEFANYRHCNVEASLQRAVFVQWHISSEQQQTVRKLYETIAEHFHASSDIFKFFDSFQGEDDVLFKKNTISFDSMPTYRNGVDEHVFNQLHCHNEKQPHDLRFLL